MFRQVLGFAALGIVLLALACTFQPLDVRVLPSTPPFDESELRIGDTVEVVTIHQQKLSFQLTVLEGQALPGTNVLATNVQGENVRVLKNDVRSIAVRRFRGKSRSDGLRGLWSGPGARGRCRAAVLIAVAVL
jgi:hypothetical protein